jgi:hypothetical protein
VSASQLVSLFDVDNTLIDNDHVKDDLDQHIVALIGPERAARFWELYEEVRHERDYVDFPGTLARYQAQFPNEHGFPRLADLVLCCPYAGWVYPGALETIAHLRALGPAVILSDGDPVFQPAKIARAGLAAAVNDNVLVYIHKEDHLDQVQRLFPARRYLLVDDKPGILARVKPLLGDRVLTVQVMQGKYAHADQRLEPPPDVRLPAIADLARLTRDQLLTA